MIPHDTTIPTRTAPRTSPAISSTVRRADSTDPSAARTSGSTAAPTSVSVTVRPDRSSRACPSSRSSRRTCALTPGWATWTRSAARVNEPDSATATKYSSWRSSITDDYRKQYS
ncbi:hypothetical protein LX88_006735 [Lentzea californiensis]|nr:hypothetical protein [Lentzea californiensis]